MKHAYLIIAYNQPLMLQRLVCALDDKRNDIFIHIDKKANINIKSLRVYKSNLYILSKRGLENICVPNIFRNIFSKRNRVGCTSHT